MKKLMICLLIAGMPMTAQAAGNKCEAWAKVGRHIMVGYQSGMDTTSVLNSLGARYSQEGTMEDLDRRVFAMQLLQNAMQYFEVKGDAFRKELATIEFKETIMLHCITNYSEFPDEVM